MKCTYIAGCWDYCHEGHVNIIKAAKDLGEFLVVGVNSDEFIWSYKRIKMGNSEVERMDSVRKLGLADVVFILENHDAQRDYIDIFQPRYIVHGSDWEGDDLYKQMNITKTQIDAYGIEFVYPKYTPGVSSTIIRTQNR